MKNFIGYVVITFFWFYMFKEVSADCDEWVTVSLERTVWKQGFHREIVSNVSWVMKNVDSKINCDLLLIYHIPCEMFIDLDEIKSLGSSDTKIVPLGNKSNFDVERPAHLSNEENVLVYLNTSKQSRKKHWEVTSSNKLPIHWRYQKPTENQYYVPVTLPRPTILAKCKGSVSEDMQQCISKLESVQYPCRHDTIEICDWFNLKQKLNSRNNEIIFTVPVGTKKHTILVASGTIFVTLSALFILMQLPWLEVSKK